MLRSTAMLRPAAITALLITGLWGIAQADVYRWVDDKGEAHYSDRWVPGSELIKSAKPHPQSADSSSPSESRPAPQPTSQKIAADQAEAANARAVQADVAKTRGAQCKQAKDRYQKAIDARRLYKDTKGAGDADRVYMSDSEADAYRLQARKDVTDLCGAPPPPAEPPQ